MRICLLHASLMLPASLMLRYTRALIARQTSAAPDPSAWQLQVCIGKLPS